MNLLDCTLRDGGYYNAWDFSPELIHHYLEALRAAGIGVNLHYIPVHTQPYYQTMGFKPGDFPEAERYYSEAISIPLFHGMRDAQQNQVIQALR